ncbi:hypothetical protein ACHAWC_005682 [Mediolabrus comicus]
MGKQKNGKKKSSSSKNASGQGGGELLYISPSRIRYQHSRIRSTFSGCGRSVTDTLDEIRRGELNPWDLPVIQVLVGPDENDGNGPWYFSLNNRRLWVFKQCLKEGLLDNSKHNNTIPVRIRLPKSAAEAERYSVNNCALEAKFMRESGGGGGGKVKAAVDNSEKESEKAEVAAAPAI